MTRPGIQPELTCGSARAVSVGFKGHVCVEARGTKFRMTRFSSSSTRGRRHIPGSLTRLALYGEVFTNMCLVFWTSERLGQMPALIRSKINARKLLVVRIWTANDTGCKAAPKKFIQILDWVRYRATRPSGHNAVNEIEGSSLQ